MHSYLRAIGFSRAFPSEHELDMLLDNIIHSFDERKVVREEDGPRAFIELKKEFGPNIGLKLCGEMDVNGFHRLCYFPYLQGSGVTSTEEISIEKRINGESYTGMVDDGRVGVSVIFYIQNPARLRQAGLPDMDFNNPLSVTLSALSVSGMILLPMKRAEGIDEGFRKTYYQKHDALVLAAKNGSQEAIESLTMEDMDTYAMITRRLVNEDVFTIVDTFFMPYGMECDLYQIMGEILFYSKIQNSVTKEYLYQLTVECNGMTFDICINEKDLLGEPEPGRRFKGNIWLQGQLNFPV